MPVFLHPQSSRSQPAEWLGDVCRWRSFSIHAADDAVSRLRLNQPPPQTVAAASHPAMSSSTSPIHALPDVLAQLVMQLLPLNDLLLFARCNRRLLSQADSACVYKHVPPFTHQWSMECPSAGLLKLMRHVPVTLKPGIKSRHLLWEHATLRLYGLDTTEWQISLSGCLQFVSRPLMQSVRRLVLEGNEWYDAQVLERVAQLPRIETLIMLNTCDSDRPPTMESIRLLRSAGSLTSLSIHDEFDPSSVLAALVDFPSLTQLTVKKPWIYDEQWVGQFASPGLRKLTSLTLDWCIFMGPTEETDPMNPAHADAVFTSLTQLTALQLKMPFGVDLILPSVRFAVALRSLRIEANSDHNDFFAPRVLPTFGVLHALMIAKTSLRIELDLRDHEFRCVTSTFRSSQLTLPESIRMFAIACRCCTISRCGAKPTVETQNAGVCFLAST